MAGSHAAAPAVIQAQRVIQVLRRIPPGTVATYGDVAAMAGGRARPGRSAISCGRSGFPGCPTTVSSPRADASAATVRSRR